MISEMNARAAGWAPMMSYDQLDEKVTSTELMDANRLTDTYGCDGTGLCIATEIALEEFFALTVKVSDTEWLRIEDVKEAYDIIMDCQNYAQFLIRASAEVAIRKALQR